MTPYQKRVTAFTKRMAEDMQLRKLSPRTIDAYTYHVDRFALRFGKHPEELGPEQVREFQLWMINELKASWSQFNQAVCALRFFYSYTCKRDWVVQQVPYGPRPKKLPVVLSGDEVARMIACVNNIKHKTVLLTLYSARLRISEGLNLKLQDIDSERMMLKVTQGKESKRPQWRELFYGPDHPAWFEWTSLGKNVPPDDPTLEPELIDEDAIGEEANNEDAIKVEEPDISDWLQASLRA